MTEEKAGEGATVHLDDQNIRDYPVLEKVLLKNEYVTCGGMSDAPRTGLAGRESINGYFPAEA